MSKVIHSLRHPHRNSYYHFPGKHRSGFFFILMLVFLSEVQGSLHERLEAALEKYLSARPDFHAADKKLVNKLVNTHLRGSNAQELEALASRLHGEAAYQQVLTKLLDGEEASSSSTSSGEAPWRRQRKGPKVRRSRSPRRLISKPEAKVQAKKAPKPLKPQAKSKVRLVPRPKLKPKAEAAPGTSMPRGSIAQQLEVQQSEVQQSEVERSEVQHSEVQQSDCQQSEVQRSEVPGSSSSSSTSDAGDEWQTDTFEWVQRDCWVCHDCGSMNTRFTLWCVCGVRRKVDENWKWQPCEGDWVCEVCGNYNFKRRQWCWWSDCPTGDWTCVCGNHNFARRRFCNRRVCQKRRPW